MVKEIAEARKDEPALLKMSGRQMLMKIVELATTQGLPDEALRKMTESLMLIVSQYEGHQREK